MPLSPKDIAACAYERYVKRVASDGFDAASMIQALKDSLEQPATIFIDG